MDSISVTDWFLFGCLAVSVVIGAWRGLVFEVLSVIVWLFAFLAGQWWSPYLVEQMASGKSSNPLYYGAAYIVIFVVVALIGGLLVQIIKRTTDAIGLRPVDRALGSLFGLGRGVIALLALTVVMRLTPFGKDVFWTSSVGAQWLTELLIKLKPFLPQAFVTFLG